MRKRPFLLFIIFTLLVTACSAQAAPANTELPATSTTAPTLPATATPTLTAVPSLTASATPSNTPTFTPIPPTQTPTQPPDSAAASSPTPSSSSGERVTISGFRFGPGTLEIKAGTKVTWINRDGTTHTVTSDTGDFDSGALDENDSFSFTFSEAGTFPYHCGFHSGMTGTIKVTP